MRASALSKPGLCWNNWRQRCVRGARLCAKLPV